MLTAEILATLSPGPAGNTLIMTVGNSLRTDDGVGPWIARQLPAAFGRYRVSDLGDQPENALDLRALEPFPTKVVMIDAADFGGRPGEARLLPEHALPAHALSTHAFPLPVIARLLRQDTGAEVFFLGIQPDHVGWGEGLTRPVENCAREIVAALQRELARNISHS